MGNARELAGENEWSAEWKETVLGGSASPASQKITRDDLCIQDNEWQMKTRGVPACRILSSLTHTIT